MSSEVNNVTRIVVRRISVPAALHGLVIQGQLNGSTRISKKACNTIGLIGYLVMEVVNFDYEQNQTTNDQLKGISKGSR
jgi:hypothetical protein